MNTTRFLTCAEVVAQLPATARNRVERFKAEYKCFPEHTRPRMSGYTQGLRDAGIITERQRQMIYVYMTV